jgi:hypothetical protein
VGVLFGLGLGWLGLGLPFFLHKQMHQSLSLSLLLLRFFFPENNSCALSPFLSPGGYCPAGSSSVTLCSAGAIDWLL